jgi:rare lipoprotein A
LKIRNSGHLASRLSALCAATVLTLAGPVQADSGLLAVNAAVAPEVPVSMLPQPGAALAAPSLELEFEPITGGVASYYGRHLAGARTASGQRFDPDALTCAHRTLAFGTKVQVTNPSNGESVVVTVNDRGPFHGNRVIDLSDAAAEEIGILGKGSGKVELAVLSN